MRALARAVVGDRRRHRRRPPRARPASRRRHAVGLDRPERGEEQRQHRGHRRRPSRRRYAIRVALAEADGPSGHPVVAELDDDGRDACPRRGRARDQERVAKPRSRISCRSGASRRGPARPASPTHGSASTAASISRQSGPPPKRTGSSAGSPVSAAISRDRPRGASSSSRCSEVLQRDRDDLRGRDEPGDRSWRSMNGGRSAIGNERLGQVVEVVVGQARLVDHDHRVRRRPVDEAERHRRVGRVVERALALDDDPVAAALALLDHPLDRALDEVADHPVDRDAPALDHHPGLAGRDERRRRRPRARADAARARPTSCRSRSPCPRSGSPACPGACRRPTAVSVPLRRAPVVDDPDARGRARPRELRVVAEERVQAGVDVEAGRIAARIVARQSSGSLPPVGAMPMRSVSGARLRASASSSVADDRDVVAGPDRPATRGRCGRPASSR